VGEQMQYIIHEKFGVELYTWHDDPQEVNNLVDDPSVMDVLDSFKLFLTNLIGDPIFKTP